jgi:PPOX class probable F420-dependent enzyme
VGRVDGMTDEVRAFLSDSTRTGKLGWTAKDGRPLVSPVWFVVDEKTDELVFNTHSASAKGRALARDPRLSLCVDDSVPPYAYVQVQGTAMVSEDVDELRMWATRIGERYMGAERAEEFGKRNGVPGELLVRLCPIKVLSDFDVSG